MGKLVFFIIAVVAFSLFSLGQTAYAGMGVVGDWGVSIDDVSMEEGNDGTTDFVFTVTAICEGICNDMPTVFYSTEEDSATEDDDYVGVPNGQVTLTQDNGGVSGTITIQVNGDTDFELDEIFFVNLLECDSSCFFADGEGEGTIENDDVVSSPGDVYVVMGACCNDDEEEPHDGSLATADLQTGELIQIGPAIAPLVENVFEGFQDGLSGLAIDSNGRFFVTAVGEGASVLLEIDKNIGAIITNVGPTQIVGEGTAEDVKIRDLSFQPGTDILFGVGQVTEGSGTNNGLFTIDTSDATVELLNVMEGSGTIRGLAFDPTDGTLYGANCSLWILDTAEALGGYEPDFVTDLDDCYDGLGIDSDGQIFGTTEGEDSLHLINPDDGSDILVAGDGENPSDVDFITTSPTAPKNNDGGITKGDPTLGIQKNGNLVQRDGFCFDLFCMDVLGFFNHLPIQPVNSGSTHTVSLSAFCPYGSNRCNYASIGAAPPGTDIRSVEWNVILKRIGLTNDWEIIEYDPNDMIGVVTGTVQVVDDSRIQYSFNIQFITPASIGTVDGNAEPPEDNMILVTELRDSKGGSSTNIFNDGVFVNDIYAYPQVETAYMQPIQVEPLCLNQDSTKRYTCAFDKVKQWTIKLAEDKLRQIYDEKNTNMDSYDESEQN